MAFCNLMILSNCLKKDIAWGSFGANSKCIANWWPQMRNDILSGSYNGCLVCAMHQPNKATYTLLNL